MDGGGEKGEQGIIKTLASDPNVLAAILDDENITENVQNNEKIYLDYATENTLNMNQENNDFTDKVEGKGDVLEKDESGTNVLSDSLELKDDGVNHRSQNERSDAGNLQEEKSDSTTENGSSEINESLRTKSVDSRCSSLSSKDVKQKDSTVNKQHNKPKSIKVKNYFIDKNKESFSRKPGKSSYAALYSQKLKLKQGNVSQKGKYGISKENKTEENPFLSEEYDQFNNSSLSFSSKHSNTTTYTNFDKSPYYSVPDYSVQSSLANPSQTIVPNYDSYLNQPYHVPYRDFGLRYSNYGHQSYQTSSAMFHPQSNVMVPVAQMQGYASQSAPPGVVYQRRPLIDQVEFFPEHDYLLSQSLTNSQFINPVQMYHRDSGMERKFISEPQLSNSQIDLPGEKERTSKLSNSTRSYSDLQKPVDFKPYTLKEYRQIKNEQVDMLGSLGPDTESEDYKEKIAKSNKQRQYAEIIRLEHAARRKHWEKKAAPPPAPARQLQAEARRQAARNYAKTVPKPKVIAPKQRNQEEDNDEVREVTLLEILKMRHEKEKNEVQTMKKELTSSNNTE